jgi:hypothetical protein
MKVRENGSVRLRTGSIVSHKTSQILFIAHLLTMRRKTCCFEAKGNPSIGINVQDHGVTVPSALLATERPYKDEDAAKCVSQDDLTFCGAFGSVTARKEKATALTRCT